MRPWWRKLTLIALLGPLNAGYASLQRSEHERLLVVSVLSLMALIAVWVGLAMIHLADKQRRYSEIWCAMLINTGALMRSSVEINLDNFLMYFFNMSCFHELFFCLGQPMSYFCSPNKFSFNLLKMHGPLPLKRLGLVRFWSLMLSNNVK